MIKNDLGIPKATLNYWFKDLKLSVIATNYILERKRKNLDRQRKKAVVILRERLLKKTEEIRSIAFNDFKDVKLDLSQRELLFAMLYLGEGFKMSSHIGLGNSNPSVMKMFVNFLRDIYRVDNEQLRCFLHLRMDQSDAKEKKYWAKTIGISEEYFRKSQFDKRTVGTKTWNNYHGVCVVYCYNSKIAKRLMVLQQIVIDKILGN
jgi:hypothetical protein